MGLGYWGRRLARVSQESPRFDLRAMVDAGPVAPFEGARLPGYWSIDEAAADFDFDAVVIATPASTHAAIGLDALERGYHVLVEKPLACSVSDGEKMVAAARDANRVLHYDATYLGAGPVAALATILPVLGGVREWHSTRQHLGGPGDVSSLYDLVVHDLAIVAALCPKWEPVWVTATGNAESGLIRINPEPSGWPSTMTVAYSRSNPVKQRFADVVVTGNAIVRWDDMAAERLVARNGAVVPIFGEREALAAIVDDFADAIEGKPTRLPARPTGQSALAGLAIIEAAERSLASGKPESIIR